MAELTYRSAVARAIAQEMDRDLNVVFLGEDVGGAGGVFKATVGLLERFGPERVRDTPISEQAILGAAMGAAMTGLRPIAEIMFADFFAVCWDLGRQPDRQELLYDLGPGELPLVIRSRQRGRPALRRPASQSVENWAMAVPGLKVVAPSTPADVIGLFAAAVRDPDPSCSSSTRVSTRPRARCRMASWSIRWARPRCCDRAATPRSSPWQRWSLVRLRLQRRSPASVSTRPSSTCAAWCRSTPRRSCARSPPPDGCSPSRRTHAFAAGGRARVDRRRGVLQ